MKNSTITAFILGMCFLPSRLCAQETWSSVFSSIYPNGAAVVILFNPEMRQADASAIALTIPKGISITFIKATDHAIGKDFFKLNGKQALLVLSDQNVISNAIAESIVMSAYRRNIPVFSDSHSWVPLGAIVAVEDGKVLVNAAVARNFPLLIKSEWKRQ